MHEYFKSFYNSLYYFSYKKVTICMNWLLDESDELMIAGSWKAVSF